MSDEKLFQAKCPQGHEIIGTYDMVPACARISGIKRTAEGLEPVYTGDSDCYWDGQTTETDDKGRLFYQCNNGDAWSEDVLVLEPET